ncbi:hypothetical protein niasHT_006433 [Heterodera trifolii]|uniref:NADAR domain-containing protein n=1 Tax=Heterodera trifolii TaxID=157864 RepID=A0ABD2M2U7_9BILA
MENYLIPGIPFLLDGQMAIKFFTRCYFTSNHFATAFQMDFDDWGRRNMHSSEQGYFALRAVEFGDRQQFEYVLNLASARDVKNRGKHVRGYNYGHWQTVKREHMLRVVYEKFRQNQPLCEALLRTGFVRLVEASTDRYWAAGLRITDEAIHSSNNWPGRNELGRVLMRVRDQLRPLPQHVHHINKHYVVCQAAAPDYVVALAAEPHVQPYAVRINNETVNAARQLQIGDTLVIESVEWREGFEQLGAEGMHDGPCWVHQARFNWQATASAVYSVCMHRWIPARAKILRCVRGGPRHNRTICSIRVQLDGIEFVLTQRNVNGNINLAQQGQWIDVSAIVVAEHWHADWGFILPPDAVFRGRHQIVSDGRVRIPVFVG